MSGRAFFTFEMADKIDDLTVFQSEKAHVVRIQKNHAPPIEYLTKAIYWQ